MKTLVLDLDQVLVFSSAQEIEKFDFEFNIMKNKTKVHVHSMNRFGLESFLF